MKFLSYILFITTITQSRNILHTYFSINLDLFQKVNCEHIKSLFNKRYSEIRNRCNDNLHYNFYKNVKLNLADLRLPNRDSHLDQFCADIRDIFILHISYLFHLNGHYMMSSDYEDCIKVDIEPEEGSQYSVAPFIQNLFTEVLEKNRPDLALKIKENTPMSLV